MSRRSRYSHASTSYKNKRFDNKKRKFFIAAIALIILAIAICVGVISYHRIVDSRLIALSESEKSNLKTSEQEVSLTLLKTDIGISKSAPESYNTGLNVTKYSLLRCDFNNNKVAILSLPSNLAFQNKSGETKSLLSIDEDGGVSDLVYAISNFVDVDINHFVSIDSEVIKKLVDDIGSVEVEIPYVIDDPSCGTQVLEAKKANLNSDQALQALRATNISNYNESHKTILESFVQSVLSKVKSSDNFDLASKIAGVSSRIKTDLKSEALSSIFNKFDKSKDVEVQGFFLNGSLSKSQDTGQEVFEARTTELSQVLSSFKGESASNNTTKFQAAVDTSSVRVEVRNGAGITGAGSKMKSILEDEGFKVDKVGNAEEGNVYPETLIVYMDEKFKDAANLIVKLYGCGRAVFGGDYYTSTSNIISIVGADWSSS